MTFRSLAHPSWPERPLAVLQKPSPSEGRWSPSTGVGPYPGAKPRPSSASASPAPPQAELLQVPALQVEPLPFLSPRPRCRAP